MAAAQAPGDPVPQRKDDMSPDQGVDPDATSARPERSRNGLQSIRRTFDVLDILARSPRALSTLEIAKIADLDRTVVHRLVLTLLDERFVQRDATGKYHLGPRSVLYANVFIDRLAVRRVALPYARDLREQISQTGSLAVTLLMRIDAEMTVLDSFSGDSQVALDAILHIGRRFPIYATGTGRAVLAYLHPEEQRKLCGENFTAELAERLKQIREAGGVDFSLGDYKPGINGIGAAIFSEDGPPITGIVAYGTNLTADTVARDSDLAKMVRRTADAIGEAVGGTNRPSRPR